MSELLSTVPALDLVGAEAIGRVGPAPASRLSALPPRRRAAAQAFAADLRERVFRPIAQASTLRQASSAARAAYPTFALIQLAMAALLVVVTDRPGPTRAALLRRSGAAWTSRLARRRLGPKARAAFDAAEDTRYLLAQTLAGAKATALRMDSQVIRALLVADFCIGFGRYLIHEKTEPRLPKRLALTFALTALEHARHAYALATEPLYAARASANAA